MYVHIMSFLSTGHRRYGLNDENGVSGDMTIL